jgi:acyl carrier protein
MTTTATIRHLFIDELGYHGSPSDLTDDFPLIANQVIDSLAMQNLISLIEARFGVDVDDDDVVPEHFSSIGAIARFVDAKRAG